MPLPAAPAVHLGRSARHQSGGTQAPPGGPLPPPPSRRCRRQGGRTRPSPRARQSRPTQPMGFQGAGAHPPLQPGNATTSSAVAPPHRRGALQDQRSHHPDHTQCRKLLPRHLRKVPEIAGPSRADGRASGHPRQLQGADEHSSPHHGHCRHLRGADGERSPLQVWQTVSQSPGHHGEDGAGTAHRPALFALFIESGIWRDYARRFLAPSSWTRSNARAPLAGSH